MDNEPLGASETDLLIAWSIGCDRTFVIAHPEYRLTFPQYVRFLFARRQRKQGTPFAYITGRKEFCGREFIVNKNVLIPRPETELVVEEVTKEIEKQNINTQVVYIDVGTGSGCIPISIAKATNKKIRTIAVDISRKALRTARKNAKRFGLDILFLRGDLLKPIIGSPSLLTGGKVIIITANLPYLTKQQFNAEKSIQKEPRNALVADNQTGFSLYEKLFQQIKTHLTNANYSLFIAVEIDPRQAYGAETISKKYFPSAEVKIKKDLAGRDRLVWISKPASLKQ